MTSYFCPDRVLRERRQWIFQPIFVRFAALISIAVALTVPPLEVVPFAAVVPWTAIAIFALGAGYAVFQVVL